MYRDILYAACHCWPTYLLRKLAITFCWKIFWGKVFCGISSIYYILCRNSAERTRCSMLLKRIHRRGTGSEQIGSRDKPYRRIVSRPPGLRLSVVLGLCLCSANVRVSLLVSSLFLRFPPLCKSPSLHFHSIAQRFFSVWNRQVQRQYITPKTTPESV